MERVIIIGCAGAGKSTFARGLRDVTGLPLYYLDRLWHRPDRTTVTRAEFDAGLEEILRRDRWIIDGNYRRTLEVRLRACDTVFLLDMPLEVCLAGAAARIGKRREDLPWLETEFDEEFRQWILHFPERNLPELYETVERYRQGRRTVVFRSREETETYLEELRRRGGVGGSG